jgi:hypothetical protein
VEIVLLVHRGQCPLLSSSRSLTPRPHPTSGAD